MKENYLETIALIERLHRLFLEVIQCELDTLKVGDISNVQALILYNLGDEQISIGELTVRGCYLGSNVSYNLKKMVQNGYIEQTTSKHDKRSFLIKLSNNGMSLCKKLDAAFNRHAAILKDNNINDISEMVEKLKIFEAFWEEESVQKPRFGIARKTFSKE